MFELISKYKPSGDQPEAIKKLVDGINKNEKNHKIKFLKVKNYIILIFCNRQFH